MTTRYLTEAELKAYVRSEIVTDNNLYVAAINSAEVWLDSKMSRKVVLASVETPAANARVFIPSGSQVMFIHDCTTITSVVDNGTTLVSGTDYQPEPLNLLSDMGEARPYYRLRRLNGYWYSSINKATISVTATWGWAAIPPMVKEACKIVAKEYFQQRDVAHGLIGITDVGGVGTRENQLVQDTVRAYQHPNSIGIG